LESWLARKKVSAATASSYRAGIRSYFSFASRRGFIKTDPSIDLPGIRRHEKKPRSCPDSVLAEAIGSASARVKLMLRLAGEHGLRCLEIASVSGSDAEETPYGIALVVHGKGDEERLAFVSNDETELCEALRNTPGFLFPGQINGHLSPRRVTELLSEALSGPWTGHKLRSRFATKAWRCADQKDLLALMSLMGHASPHTTIKYVEQDSEPALELSQAARLPAIHS
jgi:integrase/recombinase XerC